MRINKELSVADLEQDLKEFWEISGQKIRLIEKEYTTTQGAPVFTWQGKYIPKGWTDWTQGFQFGAAILQYDATGDESFLELGRKQTVEQMAPHVSHVGVHDHGFNNVSTYGNLLRLMNEGRIPEDEFERQFYVMALKVSGAVQAARWTDLPEGGYIYSFNGPHSLFVDTVRSCRSLMVAHLLGHSLMGENDRSISLLGRAIDHMKATATYSVFYGEGRDAYDEWGRTAHESIFNVNDGNFRCPNSQQGFSGFTTWTRGVAWAMVGFAEELELLAVLDDAELEPFGGRTELEAILLKAAKASCDWYIENTPTDGIPYWDGGAPNLHRLGEYLNRPSDPFNEWEPVDSSAAAIGAQGLLRLGRYLGLDTVEGKRYGQAGLTASKTMLGDPYISRDETHQGLLLHSIYHQPNGWDYVPKGSKIAYGESCMWGDYHIRELALYLHRNIEGQPEYSFFQGLERSFPAA
jgi:unsaturated chondroitin disaccharide hydrolase